MIHGHQVNTLSPKLLRKVATKEPLIFKGPTVSIEDILDLNSVHIYKGGVELKRKVPITKIKGKLKN